MAAARALPGADMSLPTWLVMPPLSRVVVLPDKNLIFFVCRANAFVHKNGLPHVQ